MIQEKFRLTSDEYNALNRLTSATKMDCWFTIQTDSAGNDSVFDLEEGKTLSMKDAVSMVYEGVDWMRRQDYHFLGISDKEISAFFNLLNKLGIGGVRNVVS